MTPAKTPGSVFDQDTEGAHFKVITVTLLLARVQLYEAENFEIIFEMAIIDLKHNFQSF